MALELFDSVTNGTMRQDKYWITRANTVNSTPVVTASIPVATNKNMLVQVVANIYRADFTSGNTGTIMASFIRASGNVSRDGTQSKVQMGGLSGASLNLNANTSTQACDIEIAGTSASVNWDLLVTVTYNV